MIVLQPVSVYLTFVCSKLELGSNDLVGSVPEELSQLEQLRCVIACCSLATESSSSSSGVNDIDCISFPLQMAKLAPQSCTCNRM